MRSAKGFCAAFSMSAIDPPAGQIHEKPIKINTLNLTIWEP